MPLVVGADVEADGQGERRVDAAHRGIERELPNGDRHAPGPLVPEAEDPLVVRDDDQADVLERALAKQGWDAVPVGRRDPCSTRAPDDVAVLLACEPDRG